MQVSRRTSAILIVAAIAAGIVVFVLSMESSRLAQAGDTLADEEADAALAIPQSSELQMAVAELSAIQDSFLQKSDVSPPVSPVVPRAEHGDAVAMAANTESIWLDFLRLPEKLTACDIRDSKEFNPHKATVLPEAMEALQRVLSFYGPAIADSRRSENRVQAAEMLDFYKAGVLQEYDPFRDDPRVRPFLERRYSSSVAPTSEAELRAKMDKSMDLLREIDMIAMHYNGKKFLYPRKRLPMSCRAREYRYFLERELASRVMQWAVLVGGISAEEAVALTDRYLRARL